VHSILESNHKVRIHPPYQPRVPKHTTPFKKSLDLANTSTHNIPPAAFHPHVCRCHQPPPRAGSYLFSHFQLPTEAEHLVWGRLCQKYAFQEVATGGAAFRPPEPHLRGAFRHVNESWIFLLQPETCSCWPSCASCVITLPGSRLRTVDRACLRAAGLDPEAACRYMFVGVGGGANIFPFNSTGVKPLLTGEPKLCFQYATIRATLVRTFATMIISHPEWQGSFALPTT
jgi:hypothetical protein